MTRFKLQSPGLWHHVAMW